MLELSLDVVGVPLVVLPVAVVGAPLVVTAKASEHWLPSSAVAVAVAADSWELQQGRHRFALVSSEADGSDELRQVAVLCVRQGALRARATRLRYAPGALHS